MSRIERKLAKLKEERDAILVAHHFQSGEVQDQADFVGGKLECAQYVRDSDARVVVVGGVDFFAELIKLFSPGKRVLLPREDALCPMTAMLEEEQLEKLNIGFILGYIKARASHMSHCHVVADFDLAEELLEGESNAAFIPDKYVGSYIAKKLDAKILLADAYCPPHSRILSTQLRRLQQEHPGAQALAHPQCRGDVLELADHIMNTAQMVEHVAGSLHEFIIGSEIGLKHRLEKEFPDKSFYFVSEMASCSTHKRIGLGDVYLSLKEMEIEVEIPGGKGERARKALRKGGYRL